MVDTHTHANRSYDTDADYEDMIKQASASVLSGICFSDHYEYLPDRNGYVDFDIEEHIRSLKHFSKKYSFKVLSGIEFGIYEGKMEKIIDAMNTHKFDSVIVSIHRLKINLLPMLPCLNSILMLY